MSELIVRNPYSGQELGRFAYADQAEIRRALDQGVRAFHSWKRSPSWERAKWLEIIASQLEARTEEFAALIRDEAGKPITLARGEVGRAIGVFRWAAAESQRFCGELLRTDTSPTGRAGFGLNTRFPRGLILGITPFNFPLNLVAHKVAPAIACGCGILIKPSPATPLIARKLIELIADTAPSSGKHLVQLLIADDAATAELTRSPEIAMISFTGSARVGAMIRAQAPEKPVALELGGNAWVVLMEDTPRNALPAIAKRIAGAAFGYSGQSCISVQNVAAAKSLWPEFRPLLQEATQSACYGDPADSSVISGPVINSDAATRIRRQLELTPGSWERIHSAARKGDETISLLSPTLLICDHALNSHFTISASLAPIVQEEIFGPVMTAGEFRTVEDIIGLVNASRYGLQTGVFTGHWPTIERLYQELDVGGLVVNDVPTTRYDHQPYGGLKESGNAREGVRYAMEEMTHSKFLSLSSALPL